MRSLKLSIWLKGSRCATACVLFLFYLKSRGLPNVLTKSILESISPKVVGLEDEYRTAMFLYFRYD